MNLHSGKASGQHEKIGEGICEVSECKMQSLDEILDEAESEPEQVNFNLM